MAAITRRMALFTPGIALGLLAAWMRQSSALVPATGGTVIEGRVVWAEPELPPRRVDATKQLLTDPWGKLTPDRDIVDRSLIVNPKNRGLANVIVFEDAMPQAAKPIAPCSIKLAGYELTPRVQAAAHGSHLRVTCEPGHSLMLLYGFFPKGDYLLTPKDEDGRRWEATLTTEMFGKREFDLTSILCVIHPWERAYIIVVRGNAVGITDGDGKFRFQRSSPGAGAERLRVWHERFGFIRGTSKSGDSFAVDKPIEISARPRKASPPQNGSHSPMPTGPQ